MVDELISLNELKEEVKLAGKKAYRGQTENLVRVNTSLRLTDVFDFDSLPRSRNSSRAQQSSTRASTPTLAASSVRQLRGSAMHHGSGGEQYGWTVEDGSSMQFALSPEYQKGDFDRDFYQMFLSSNDTNKLDIDSWRATMGLSKEMFPNTGVLSKHAQTSAFGAQRMKFNRAAYPTKKLQAYGKWYIKDKGQWQADFSSATGGVVPHDMLTAEQRHRKQKLAEKCSTMKTVIAKHDISYIYRDAVRQALKHGDKSLGTRVPAFLNDLPADRPEKVLETSTLQQKGPMLKRQGSMLLKRHPSRLQMAANAVRHGVQVARAADRSQPE